MGKEKKSLKDQNRRSLTVVVLANVLILYLLSQAKPLEAEGIAALIDHWTKVLPTALLYTVVGILTEIVGPETKARLVFWRWKDPLPGARAFSEHIVNDPRVDIAKLTAKLGSLPSTPRDQNATWYRIYLTMQDEPQIEHANKAYLFARDYAVLSALILVCGVPLSIWLVGSHAFCAGYAAALALQYLVVRQAAKNNGEALIKNVLSLYGAM